MTDVQFVIEYQIDLPTPTPLPAGGYEADIDTAGLNTKLATEIVGGYNMLRNDNMMYDVFTFMVLFLTIVFIAVAVGQKFEKTDDA